MLAVAPDERRASPEQRSHARVLELAEQHRAARVGDLLEPPLDEIRGERVDAHAGRERRVEQRARAIDDLAERNRSGDFASARGDREPEPARVESRAGGVPPARRARLVDRGAPLEDDDERSVEEDLRVRAERRCDVAQRSSARSLRPKQRRSPHSRRPRAWRPWVRRRRVARRARTRACARVSSARARAGVRLLRSRRRGDRDRARPPPLTRSETPSPWRACDRRRARARAARRDARRGGEAAPRGAPSRGSPSASRRRTRDAR